MFVRLLVRLRNMQSDFTVSMAASSRVSIAIIKEVLGHTDIRTTQKYSHINVLSQSQVFAAQDKKAYMG